MKHYDSANKVFSVNIYLIKRKSPGGEKNSGMSSFRSAGLFITLSHDSSTLTNNRSGASKRPFYIKEVPYKLTFKQKCEAEKSRSSYYY